MEALVIKSTGSWYQILTSENNILEARIRGKIRLTDQKVTNPVAVGDRVQYEPEGNDAVITNILPRENYIIRKAVKLSSKAHIIASNLDQVMLIVTLKSPVTSYGFIDRFLISAESFRIPQVLVFNKQDILDNKDLEKQNKWIEIYENIGVKCLKVSALKGENLLEMKTLLKNNTTLISGHSGVGKSTLLNGLYPEKLSLRTAEVSSFADKGVHTTTFAEMYIPEENTRVIDTPGIKELGLFDMEDYELADYFPEMRCVRSNCKFHNCLHIKEPKCAVKQAVEEGAISTIRYKSYISMLLNDDNRN